MQRVLDDAWVAAVADLHRGFQATGLSTVPLARALESQVRPPRLVAGEFRLTLRGDLVRTTQHEGGLEVRPLHLGYRAAFGISRKAHCQLDLELRQIPPPAPAPVAAPPPPSSISVP